MCAHTIHQAAGRHRWSVAAAQFGGISEHERHALRVTEGARLWSASLTGGRATAALAQWHAYDCDAAQAQATTAQRPHPHTRLRLDRCS